MGKEDDAFQKPENVLCLVCCFSFQTTKEDDQQKSESNYPVEDEEDKDRDPSSSGHFKLFCEDLQHQQQIGGQKLSSSNSKQKFIATSLLTLLKLSSCKERLSICLECMELIRTTMNSKHLVKETEGKVRALQKAILQEMRSLQGHVENYHVDMRRIAETVEGSDAYCLQYHIDKERTRGTKVWMKRDIDLFRQSVLEVSNQLDHYKKELDQKILTRKDSTSSSSISKSQIPKILDFNLSNSFSISYSKPLKLQIREVGAVATVEASSCFPSAEESKSKYFKIEAVNPPSSPPTVVFDKETSDEDEDYDYIVPSDIDNDDDEDDDDDDCQDSDYSNSRDKKKASSSSSSQSRIINKRKRRPSSSLSLKRLQPTTSEADLTTFSELAGIDLRKIRPFRREIIIRAVKRRDYMAKRVINETDIEIIYDPLKHFYSDYVGGADGKLMVGNTVEILIDEEKKRLQCSVCSYFPDSNAAGSYVWEKCLQLHIVRKHMDKFKCPIEGCGVDKLISERSFRLHIQAHKDPKTGGVIQEMVKPEPLLNLTGIDLDSMPPFKKSVVLRALNRKATRERESKALMRGLTGHGHDSAAEGKKQEEEEDIEVKYEPKKYFQVDYFGGDEDKLMVGKEVEILINEEEKQLQCSLCNFTPNTIAQDYFKERCVFIHVLTKHMDRFPCPVDGCGERLKNQWGFKQHLKTHKGLEALRCEVCGRPATSADNHLYHLWSHKSEEDVAEALRNGERDPRRHCRERRSQKVFRCKECGKCFQASQFLRAHEKIHENREKIVCPKCGRSMLKKSYDLYHKRYACVLEGEPKRKKHKCPYCTSTFNKLGSLNTHMRNIHKKTDEKSWMCEVCGKGFSVRHHMISHMIIHKDRSFECSRKCGMTFYCAHKWRKHEKVCKGVKQKIRKWKNGYCSWSKEALQEADMSVDS